MTDEPLLVFTLRALRDSVVPHLPPMDSTSCFGGVPSTGHSYQLVAGAHEFWWMTKENRVGFDMNYKK